MIVYLDTSSLVKLYVEETNSDMVRGWVAEAELVATCRVAYPETVSALTRRFRSGDLSASDYKALLQGFSDDWSSYVALDFDELEAGVLVKKHGLRGFDAVHLSAARLFINNVSRPAHLAFSSFDTSLNKAAINEGLTVLTV
ncbi:MAG TPA: type II toxin-antitoxin system VapC family toxin [Geobacteraceae bacterium]|nr:type II toxin-antitoxin system VapC family toxin [Geobacteraceae bacterium]